MGEVGEGDLVQMRNSELRGAVGTELKVILLFCLSVLVLIVDSLPTLFYLYLATVAVFLAARIGRRRLIIWLIFSLAVLWGFLVTQAVFYPQRPRTVLFELIPSSLPLLGSLTGGVSLYWEGALYGTMQSLRFLTLLTAGLSVVWTTSPNHLLHALRRLRLPYKLAFMVATALRFMPTIAKEAQAVMTAMRVRGFPMRLSRPWTYLQALAAGLTPIMVRNIRRASMLADSVECRGFALAGNRIPVSAGKRVLPGKILMITAPMVVLLLLISKLLHFAAQNGFFYARFLDWLYVLVESYL